MTQRLEGLYLKDTVTAIWKMILAEGEQPKRFPSYDSNTIVAIVLAWEHMPLYFECEVSGLCTSIFGGLNSDLISGTYSSWVVGTHSHWKFLPQMEA